LANAMSGAAGITVRRGLAEEIATQTDAGKQNIVTVTQDNANYPSGKLDVTVTPVNAKTLVPATPVK